MEVNSSQLASDDDLAGKMLGTQNEIVVPKVGMKFADENEVFKFYKRYVYRLGFSFRKKKFNKER